MSSRVCSFAAIAALVLAVPARAEDKTLTFERPLFLEDRGGGGKVKHVFRLASVDGDWDASVSVTHAGTKAEATKERERWLGRFKTRTGEPLDEDAPPPRPFEGGAVKGELSTMSGMVEDRWTKAVSIALEGPDGVWVVRLQGGPKTVDKHHDDFLRFARSAKVAGASAEKPAQGEPDEWRALVARAKALLDENAVAKAAPLIERARELAPDEPEVGALRGELLYLQKKPGEAYLALSNALKADPSLVRARRIRVYISIERRRDGAQFPMDFADDLEKAIAVYGDDLRLRDARARERYIRQRWREALADFDVILAPEARKQGEKGSVADLLRARAFCHIKTRNFDKALADCRDAIALDPKNGVGYRFLATVELEHGDAKKAIEALDHAVELLHGEDRNDAKLLRIEAKEKSGDLAGAIADLESFVEENPSSKFMKRATDALDRIRAANEKKLDEKDEKKPAKKDDF